MGRQKNVPIKSKRTGEIWSAHNYVPVFKKKKNRRNKSEISCSYIITASNEENRQFFIGSLVIGKTNNVFPNNYSQCRISFKLSEDEKEPDTFILDCDQTLILISSTIDAIFLKEIVTSKVFSLDFISDGEDVLLNIYFLVLPLPKFYPKIGKCLKAIFELLYEIETDTAIYLRSELQGNLEILNIYKKLCLMRGNKFERLNLQHQMLKPNLRIYQQDAVQWMLYREQMSLIESDLLHPLYTTITLKSGQEIYFDRFTGFITNIKPVVSTCNKGGILADEMGLGKTVEVLACILLNPQEPENFLLKVSDGQGPVIDKPKRKRKMIQDNNETIDLTPVDSSKNIKVPRDWVKSSRKKSDNKIALELWYNQILSSTSTIRQPVEDPDEPLIQCVCGSRTEDGLIECESCGKYQHRFCLGYNKLLGKYYCPQCWMDEPLIDCGATLIVTPISLRTQWCKEICKHIKGNLKVLRYEGYNTSPVYPTQLRQYDIVITTYNVLQNELKLTENGQVINLRRERKYSPPGCPLVRMRWWRLCLDEAQAVEAPSRMISEMAKRIPAHYRWAVTGTPISKNISDLFGLIDYLQITPYNDFDTWKNVLYEPYTRGNETPLLNFLSEVLWRNSKNDVADQINIPKQTFKEHILEFSAVEKYFYKREHEMSRRNFLATVEKYDSNLLLEQLDKGTLKTILAPLLTLRYTCTQPNTVKGRYMATKKELTSMKELLDALILKNISDSEECLRVIISSLNGLAGVELLLKSPQEAIKHYRQVLQFLMRFTKENNSTKLTVDKLQVIHTMHNLAEVLEKHPPEQPTLRDKFLRKDCMEMEQKYMDKFENQTALAYESSKTSLDQVEKLQGNFILKYGQWYSDGLDCILIHNHFDEFMERVHNTCENANITCNLRSASQRNILMILYDWDENIFNLRSKLFKSLEDLYEIDSEHDNKLVIKACLVEKAMDCHLRPQKKSHKSVNKCSVCMANDRLKLYEGKLFDMVIRKKTFEDMSLSGAWRPTMEELVFKVLYQVLKVKSYKPELVKDGETYIALLEMLKKEFKEIRKFWTFLDQQVCAQDELDICKVRLQLREMVNNNDKKMNKVMKNLTYVMENKYETVNLLSVHELDYQHSVLNTEVSLNNEKLDKLLGTQSYLETLRRQQYEGQSPDPCPICKNTLEQHWSILLCGHSYCLDCIQVLFGKITSDYIHCSVCRNRQIIQDISYIKAGNTVTDEDTNIIKGNFSTKIEAVVKLLIDLKSQNPDVKVLLFSSWITVLKSLKKALEINAVTCELAQSSNMEVRIEDFKNPSNAVTALLLPINLGSKGLNLIEATHVILVEPLLNPADELQAIGRVHRIGQTKPTVVHRFLVKNTIEESIFQATSSNAENWDKNKVTLQCLMDLFKMSDVKQEDIEPQHENIIP